MRGKKVAGLNLSTREFLRDIKAKKTARTGKYRVSCVRRHEARVFKHFATFVLQSVREKKTDPRGQLFYCIFKTIRCG